MSHNIDVNLIYVVLVNEEVQTTWSILFPIFFMQENMTKELAMVDDPGPLMKSSLPFRLVLSLYQLSIQTESTGIKPPIHAGERTVILAMPILILCLSV